MPSPKDQACAIVPRSAHEPKKFWGSLPPLEYLPQRWGLILAWIQTALFDPLHP